MVISYKDEIRRSAQTALQAKTEAGLIVSTTSIGSIPDMLFCEDGTLQPVPQIASRRDRSFF